MFTFAKAFQDFCAGLADLPGESFADRVNALTLRSGPRAQRTTWKAVA